MMQHASSSSSSLPHQQQQLVLLRRMIVACLVLSNMVLGIQASSSIICPTSLSQGDDGEDDYIIRRPFDPSRHKRVYTVGVLAIRGVDAAYKEFNKTFSDYLTATAGQQFDQPIEFQMKPLKFLELFPPDVDYIYVNPSAFSCIESEFKAHSLVSQISRRKVGGQTFDLKKFGGVIIAKADNDEIQTIHDLKDKVVAAASISGLGSGQMQFLEMQQGGMSYVNDPKQLVFTSNQGKVVNGVLNDDFDVGFVRTDQMERTKDADGNPIDTSLLKVIHVKPNLTIDGVQFPFTASTPLYPEWNVAALDHVPEDVNIEVQRALLQLTDVVNQYNNSTANACEREVFQIADDAMKSGKYAGWQTTLSYMQLRSMQEATQFISFDSDTNTWQCIRPATLYDSITCPQGYYKVDEASFETHCYDQHGLECKEGYQCICTPCEPIKVCDELEIQGRCLSYAFFLPIILVPVFIVILIAVHCYVSYKHRQADAIWIVKPEELKFDEPAKAIGRGTFGLVLLAEYRGTQVAVKRVIPPIRRDDGDGFSWARFNSDLTSSSNSPISDNENNPGLKSMAPYMIKEVQRTGSLDLNPKKISHSRLKADFVQEMRHLAKLRHPCITTVMGAVVSRRDEPMLVMEYMAHGSLFEVLRDEKTDIEKEKMSILKDVAQGLRFLHAAQPQVIHGDLKAKNVLIDSNFRAKVADFGLTAKKYVGASGTPFWMSPELLLRKSNNTAASDVYAFGMLLYEVYSGKIPYEREDPDEVIRQVCDPVIDKRPPTPKQCPPKAAKLMKDCLQRNPCSRPTSEQIDLQVRVEVTVNERTSKLEALNRELAEANSKIASASTLQLQHFACMSHEIRTPLNCVLGLSGLLEETDLDPSQKESLSMIVSSGELLRDIVDDVLDFSKLESGIASVDIKPSNLEDIISEAVTSMASSAIAQKKNVMIRTYYGPRHCVKFNTDSRRLKQILYNLLSNAVKFSKDGGIVELQVAIETPAGNDSDQDLRENDEKKVIRFIVKDYGKGIQSSEFEKIFTPFTQTDAGINNTNGGTGLGLAITKKLSEAMGGTVAVDSKVGEWTVFVVDFPFDGTLTDMTHLADILKSARFTIVNDPGADDTDQIIKMLSPLNVDFSQCNSMKELHHEVISSGTKQFNRSCVILVHGELYAEESFKLLSKYGNFILITFGTQHSCSSAHSHYHSAGEMLPCGFLKNVADSLEALKKAVPDTLVSECCMKSSSLPIAPNLTDLRVLIAEDNRINQKVLKRILNRLEIEAVEIVENGKLAVEREAAKPFDVVLMDLQMPVMDGIEACSLIVSRKDGSHSKPKIIFVTAHVSETFRKTCMENGAVGYLPKPVTKDNVKEALEKALLGYGGDVDAVV